MLSLSDWIEKTDLDTKLIVSELTEIHDAVDGNTLNFFQPENSKI